MPSISQAELDRLNGELQSTARMAQDERERRQLSEARVAQCDAVLAKVVATAGGTNLQSGYEARAIGGYAQDMGDQAWRFNPLTGDALAQHYPDPLERSEAVIAGLHQRLLVAEGRLSAVVAVAQFARDHKA